MGWAENVEEEWMLIRVPSRLVHSNQDEQRFQGGKGEKGTMQKRMQDVWFSLHLGLNAENFISLQLSKLNPFTKRNLHIIKK